MLRHFEELELLIPIRNSKNYRCYTEMHIPNAIKIKSFQKMGFSLREIKTILSMSFDQLEKNLTFLYKAKEKERKKIENQLFKIRLVAESIKNKNSDFSVIEQLVEVNADDRAQILLGYEDLANRVVRGKMPRVEIVNEELFKLLQKDNEVYEHDSVDIWKYGEYFKVAPRSHYVLFEVEELVCYFLVSISEDEIAKHTDIFVQDNFLSIANFAQLVIDNYSLAWKTTYMPLTITRKGISDDLGAVSKLFADNEILLSMRFKRIKDDDTLLFTLGLPLSVIKAVDSATPYKFPEK